MKKQTALNTFRANPIFNTDRPEAGTHIVTGQSIRPGDTLVATTTFVTGPQITPNNTHFSLSKPRTTPTEWFAYLSAAIAITACLAYVYQFVVSIL